MNGSEKRSSQFDILKGLGILLVVFGHYLSQRVFLIEDQSRVVINIIYAIIFSFHMPLFIFISGYFTGERYKRGDSYYKQAIRSYIIPFIIMNFVLTISSSSFSLNSFANFLYPKYTLWYLLSLFFWKIMIGPCSQLKYPLITSILLSLFIGFTKISTFLSIHRTIAFFPIFLLGAKFNEERLLLLKKKVPFIVGFIGIILCMLIASIVYLKENSSAIYYLRDPYSSFGDSFTYCVLRGYALLIGVIMTLSLIVVIPDSENFLGKILAEIGRNSMPLYLVHGFIIVSLKELFTGYEIFNSFQFIGFAIIFTIVMAMLFANKYVQKYYTNLIQWISKWILK